jgi:hypothetical protein
MILIYTIVMIKTINFNKDKMGNYASNKSGGCSGEM